MICSRGVGPAQSPTQEASASGPHEHAPCRLDRRRHHPQRSGRVFASAPMSRLRPWLMSCVPQPAGSGALMPGQASPLFALASLTMIRLECVLCSLRQAACLGRCLRCCKHHASMKALEGQRICPPAANWGGGQLRVPGPPTCVRGRRKLKLRRAWAGTTLLVAAAAARAFANLGPVQSGGAAALHGGATGRPAGAKGACRLGSLPRARLAPYGPFFALVRAPDHCTGGVVAPMACWMYRSIQKRSKTADHMRAGVC